MLVGLLSNRPIRYVVIAFRAFLHCVRIIIHVETCQSSQAFHHEVNNNKAKVTS